MAREVLLRSLAPPGQPVRYCGPDCTRCETHTGFLKGDVGGLVSEETGYRCCWLPSSFPEGSDCPIKACCEGSSFDICGACGDFPACELLRLFYAQHGYNALRERVIQLIRERRERWSNAGLRRETTGGEGCGGDEANSGLRPWALARAARRKVDEHIMLRREAIG